MWKEIDTIVARGAPFGVVIEGQTYLSAVAFPVLHAISRMCRTKKASLTSTGTISKSEQERLRSTLLYEAQKVASRCSSGL